MAARLLAPTPVRAGNLRSGRQTMSRRSGGGGGSSGSRMPRKLPQFPQPKPTPAPTPTPFQPGAGPSPPLGLIFAGVGLLIAAGQALWGLLNYRPAGSVETDPVDTEIELFGGAVGFVRIRAKRQTFTTVTSNCSTGQVFGGEVQDGGFNQYTSPFLQARSIITGTLQVTRQQLCSGSGFDAGTPTLAIGYRNSAGTVEALQVENVGAVSYGQQFSGTTSGRWYDITTEIAGEVSPLVLTVPGSFAPGMQPLAPAPALQAEVASAPSPMPALAPLPAAAPAGAPVPERSPAPGGAPSTAPAPAPSGAPSRAPAPAPGVAQPLPGALPVTPTAPIQLPTPGPIIPTPAEVVVVNGQQIGGPGQAPAPNMQAMAQELGRLERKTELTLEGGATAVAVGALKDLVQSLIEKLLAITPGTTYSIQPPCGTKENGDPLDPVEVEAPGALTPIGAVLNRVDALAMLIDEHKQIRQPICKGKPTGQPVTVTFVEADP